MDSRKVFEENFKTIEEAIRLVCARKNIRGEEAEEFSSHVQCKIVEDDYKVLKSFQGRSSLKTYIFTVVNRILVDRHRESAGRWRPSEKARKMGETAQRLEELLYRHDHSLDEAYKILTVNHKVPMDAEQVRDLARQLPERPQRGPRRAVINRLEEIPANDSSLETTLLSGQRKTLEKIDEIVQDLSGSFSDEDRLILKMKFEDALNSSLIARTLHRERHYVERRVKWMLAKFKEGMLARGLKKEDIKEVMDLD